MPTCQGPTPVKNALSSQRRVALLASSCRNHSSLPHHSCVHGRRTLAALIAIIVASSSYAGDSTPQTNSDTSLPDAKTAASAHAKTLSQIKVIAQSGKGYV